jgi:hypothetical protein
MLTATKKKGASIRPETEMLMLTAGASLITDLVFISSPTSIMLSSIIGLALTTGLYPKESSKLATAFKQIYRRTRWSGAILVSAMALYLVNFLASPAQAQFLNQTESWMTEVFPQASEIAPLIFNAVRLVIVLFVIFKAYQAVQAGRNDEEWQSLVKVPLTILVLVSITDITVGFITGGGSGGNP